MNFTAKALGLIFLIGTSTLFSNQSLSEKNTVAKCLGYLASTKAMYLFDKYIQNAIQQQLHKITPFGNELASAEHQLLGKEAQTAVGVPAEYQVAIKKLSRQHPLIKYIGAITETDGIYINEEQFNQLTYEAIRVLLFHEAVHKKYNDLSSFTILRSGAFFSSIICIYSLLKRIDKFSSQAWLTQCGITYGLSLIPSYFMLSKFQKFIERRADIEGAYASGCHVCVKQLALSRKWLFEEVYNPIKYNGYLGYDELEKIVQELEQQSKLCDHHKNKN